MYIVRETYLNTSFRQILCHDIFINTNKLVELADQEMYASNRMYGNLLRRIGPEREIESKSHHPVSLEEWPWR